jgi:hypothetical protein
MSPAVLVRRGLLGGMVLLAPCGVSAQEMEVPVAVQIPLFLKVISFDRQLRARGEGEFVLAVAYQNGNRASADARDEVIRVLKAEHPAVRGLPVRVVTIDLDRESLADCLKADQASLLYMTPLRAIDVGALVAIASAADVTTATGVTQYVSLGVAIGVRLQRDRPKILINLQGARSQGADFTAELLKLAEVR